MGHKAPPKNKTKTNTQRNETQKRLNIKAARVFYGTTTGGRQKSEIFKSHAMCLYTE